MGEAANEDVLFEFGDFFDSKWLSDCEIVFVKEKNPPPGAAASSSESEASGVLGTPLPAHRLVLVKASKRFHAELERWTPEAPAARAPDAVAASRHQLRIPLGSEAEVPAARAAIQFAYTREVAAGDSSSVRKVLEMRRQAAYLQISGCAEACDELVKAKLNGRTANASTSTEGGSNKRARTAGPLWPAVLELYGCEALWPDPKVPNSNFGAILASAKRLLVAHFHDTLATLNTPSLREQMVALPAVALEALLGSDDFGTDNESSVLLLLAIWMKDNLKKTTAEIRQQLCRAVRVVHLSRPYLAVVLPALAADHEEDPEAPAGWFMMGGREAALVFNFASVSQIEQRLMLSVQSKMPSILEWQKASPRAQCIPANGGLSYSWHITKDQLLSAMGRLSTERYQYATGMFDECGNSHLFACGFLWSVFVKLTSGRSMVGLSLKSSLPAAVTPPGSRLSREPRIFQTTYIPIQMTVRMTVHRRQGDFQGKASTMFGNLVNIAALDCILLELLPLQQEPGATGGNTAAAPAAAADPLAAWANFLIDGKISGTVTLLNRRP